MNNHENNLGKHKILIGSGDFFYIPNVMERNYTIAAELFRNKSTFVEVAIDSIIHGLSPAHDILYINGAALWAGRNEPWKYYDEREIFVHPFKLKSSLESAKGKEFFCDTYLKRYGSFLSREGYKVKKFVEKELPGPRTTTPS